jgi:hypothetical protein
MMKANTKGLKIYLIAAVVIVVVYIVAQVNKPKEINWSETLDRADKIPFGTFVFDKRVSDIFPGAHLFRYTQPVYNVLTDTVHKQAALLIICKDIQLSKVDYQQLVKFIKAGNDVFISASYYGAPFRDTLNIKTGYAYNIQVTGVPNRFMNSKKTYSVNRDAGNLFFDSFDTTRAVVLGENSKGHANFLRFNMGKGALYLMPNPRMFTNYSLLKTSGVEYIATALSFLQKPKEVLLDDYYVRGPQQDESPMRVFLKNPPLSWAYYIALFSLLIFVLYEMKRRQRIIPEINPLQNSTVDFVTVVGQVYFENRNNTNIARKMIIYFLAFVRDEFQLQTNKLDQDFVDRLSKKTGLDENLILDLVNQVNYVNVQLNVTDRELLTLNNLTQQFYNKTR